MSPRAAAARVQRLDHERRPFPTAVIVPVLGRPHRVLPLLESLAAATRSPWTCAFVVDADDPEEGDACEDAAELYPVRVVECTPGACYAAKVNLGIAATDEPVVFIAADDLAFHDQWLTRAQARLGQRVHVVGTNDLYNPRVVHGRHSTHSLVTREYVETRGTVDEPGKALHEGYPHAYCDDEFVQTARSRRAFAMARDAVVEHLHPFAGKAAEDWVYAKGRGLDDAGRAVYESRRHLWARHFGP